jgi:hypothetical protein
MRMRLWGGGGDKSTSGGTCHGLGVVWRHSAQNGYGHQGMYRNHYDAGTSDNVSQEQSIDLAVSSSCVSGLR